MGKFSDYLEKDKLDESDKYVVIADTATRNGVIISKEITNKQAVFMKKELDRIQAMPDIKVAIYKNAKIKKLK